MYKIKVFSDSQGSFFADHRFTTEKQARESLRHINTDNGLIPLDNNEYIPIHSVSLLKIVEGDVKSEQKKNSCI